MHQGQNRPHCATAAPGHEQGAGKDHVLWRVGNDRSFIIDVDRQITPKLEVGSSGDFVTRHDTTDRGALPCIQGG
jgi:hypothetical protein